MHAKTAFRERGARLALVELRHRSLVSSREPESGQDGVRFAAPEGRWSRGGAWRQALEVGDQVVAIVKSTEVMIGK